MKIAFTVLLSYCVPYSKVAPVEPVISCYLHVIAGMLRGVESENVGTSVGLIVMAQRL
jgi:hypothetical protein